jgi:two-component sensor histidine kinase
LLLKEVDHRIKNSLQIVSGLLHLQAKTADHARLRDGASIAVSHIQNAASRRSLSLRRQGELCTRPNIAGRR